MGKAGHAYITDSSSRGPGAIIVVNLENGNACIAISPDGKMLFFCPLTSRHLYSISTEALRDRTISDFNLSYLVQYWGEKGASDGMTTDAKGNIYAGDYENDSIRKILPNGIMETIAHDPRILWPDTFSIGPDQ